MRAGEVGLDAAAGRAGRGCRAHQFPIQRHAFAAHPLHHEPIPSMPGGVHLLHPVALFRLVCRVLDRLHPRCDQVRSCCLETRVLSSPLSASPRLASLLLHSTLRGPGCLRPRLSLRSATHLVHLLSPLTVTAHMRICPPPSASSNLRMCAPQDHGHPSHAHAGAHLQLSLPVLLRARDQARHHLLDICARSACAGNTELPFGALHRGRPEGARGLRHGVAHGHADADASRVARLLRCHSQLMAQVRPPAPLCARTVLKSMCKLTRWPGSTEASRAFPGLPWLCAVAFNILALLLCACLLPTTSEASDRPAADGTDDDNDDNDEAGSLPGLPDTSRPDAARSPGAQGGGDQGLRQALLGHQRVEDG